ncbi:MAG TPA: formimidoylglutamase [Rhodothermales bacterium]|nr:formimidoylglutamase [Rhodothermales bacterium]HRR09236.1 formimidoylglutamase [Rhodothermales bacterium]
MYQNPDHTHWYGRIDGETPEYWRWHQAIKTCSLSDPKPAPSGRAVALLGFACDEGVRRNQGRIGASLGPASLRDACRNLPWHFPDSVTIFDAGDIVCIGTQLEEAQLHLSDAIHQLQRNQYFTVVMGGGHEVLYGHYKGLRKTFPDANIGIINFDAHFDLRAVDPDIGPTSGTGFWQIAQEEPLRYLALGIQRNGNTKALFEQARVLNVTLVQADDFQTGYRKGILDTIHTFIASMDMLYLTICLDVFATAFAPGVSAPTALGLHPDAIFRDALRPIISSPKLASMDIAELNPNYDEDNRTAKLAAHLISDIIFTQTLNT